MQRRLWLRTSRQVFSRSNDTSYRMAHTFQRYTSPSTSHSWRRALGIALATTTGVFLAQREIFSYRADEGSDSEPTLKERIFGAYENRIRELSAPEKIFEYFASVKKGSGADKEWFMTPADFIRAITPYNYKEGAAVGAHNSQFHSSQEVTAPLEELLSAVDQNKDGLISFAEYIFFSTLLSIPPRYFRVAFDVFDEDGNGSLSADEFKAVIRLLRQSNPLAQAQRSDEDLIDEACLCPLFFGDDGEEEVKFATFEEFLLKLRFAVLQVQFNAIVDSKDDKISARDFAMNLISYANSRHMTRLLARVEKLADRPDRISFQEYSDFNKVLESLEEIQFALTAFGGRGKAFDKEQMRRAARAASDVNLSDSVLDIVFFLFDDNDDGNLDDQEFLAMLEGRQSFGVSKPRDSGFVRFTSCVTRCLQEESYSEGNQTVV